MEGTGSTVELAASLGLDTRPFKREVDSSFNVFKDFAHGVESLGLGVAEKLGLVTNGASLMEREMQELNGALGNLSDTHAELTRESDRLQREMTGVGSAADSTASEVKQLSKELTRGEQTAAQLAVSNARSSASMLELADQADHATREAARLSASLGDTERRTEAASAASRAHASALDETADQARALAHEIEKQNAELRENVAVLDALSRNTKAESQALLLSAGNTKQLTREQQALVRITREGIDSSSEHARALIESARRVDKLEDEIRSANQAADALSGGLGRLTAGLAGLFSAAALGSAAVLAFQQFKQVASDTVSTLTEYKQRLAELSAITGVTGAGLDQLSDAALDMGSNTKFAASDAASAFQLVASAKSELTDNLGSLESVTREVLELAAASGEDLATSARIATATMNQFGLGADEAGRAVNVLAAGAQKGASLVAETGEALKYAGSLANTASVSLESTVAAIQVLATNEVKASSAGTGLTSVLASLEKQTESKFKPSVVGLGTALENLRGENLDLTRTIKLFGVEAAKSADILIKNADKFRDMETSITGTNTASEQAKTQSDTLRGSWQGLQSAAESLKISIGEVFEDDLRAATDQLREMAIAIKFWTSEIQDGYKALKKFGGIATGISAILPGVNDAFDTLVAGVANFRKEVDKANSIARMEQTLKRLKREIEGEKKALEDAAKAHEYRQTQVRAVTAAEATLLKGLEKKRASLANEIELFGEAKEVIDAYSILKANLPKNVDFNDEFVQSILAEARSVAQLREQLTGLKTEEKEREKQAKEAAKLAADQARAFSRLAVDTEIQAETIRLTVDGYYELTQVQRAWMDLSRDGISVLSAFGLAKLAAAKQLDTLTRSAKRARTQRELDDSLQKEIDQLNAAAASAGQTAEQLIRLEAATLIAQGATADLVGEWVDANIAALELEQGTQKLADTTALYADLAHAALDTVFQAGVDLWDGQIDSFGAFKDNVLDGLEEILQKLLVMSATQWILPESLGGAGGAFDGFGLTDLGRLFGAGGSGGIKSLFGGSLMSNHGAVNVGAYAGPALAGVAIGGSILTAIDSISDGGLFGTSWEELSRTVEFSVENGLLSGFERVEREREQSLFGGTETEVLETALPGEMQAIIQQVYDTINNVLVGGAASLGLEAGQTLRESLGQEFSVGVIAGEDYLGAVSRHLVRMGERLAVEVAPGIELVTRNSESLIDALARVSQTSESVTSFLGGFGVDVDTLISSDLISQTVADYSQHLIQEMQAATVNALDTGGIDSFGLNINLDQNGQISDETRAQLEQSAADLAAQLNLTAEDIEATILQGADAIQAARLVYLDQLEQAAGGNEALTVKLTEFAGYWQNATTDAAKTLESAIAGIRGDLTAGLESLNTSTETFLADYNAAISGALSPEDLLAWVDLGNQLGRMLELERELARIRGEALDFGTLTAEQQRQVIDETNNLNDALAGLGSNAVVSNQGLLELTNTLGEVANITDFVSQVYRDFTPEAERIAAEMSLLNTAASDLGLDLTGSVDSIKAEYRRILDDALTSGDGDAVAQLRSIFGILGGYLEDLEDQAANLQQQQEEADRAAENAAAALRELNTDLTGLGIGLEYTSDRLQAVADELGSVDQVANQWQFVLANFFDPLERAELDLVRTGENIAGAGLNLNRLSEEGLAYYRDQLLQANALGDATSEAELLRLAQDVKTFIDATVTLGEAGAQSRAELEQLTETIAGITSGINAQIAQVNATGVIPASQLDQLTGRIAQVRELLDATDSVNDEVGLRQELANLITQRYNLERDAILDNARAQLDAENELRRQRNTMNREEYQRRLSEYRDLQRLGETVTGYSDRIANTGLAPVVQFDDAQGDFREVLQSILSGQSTDGGALTGSADQYLDLAQELFGATPQFYAILGEVQAALGEVQALAGSAEEPVEPPEIALMTDISQSSNIMAQAQRELGERQVETTAALNEINDELAKLLKEQAEAEQLHRDTHTEHMTTVEDLLGENKRALETVAEKEERFWFENNNYQKLIEANSLRISGGIDQLITTIETGGVDLSDRFFDVMFAQLETQRVMSARLSGVESALNYMNLLLGDQTISVNVTTTCNCGTGEPGDEEHDTEAQEVEAENA